VSPAGRYLAGPYLDALARAAGWAGSDPGLPARPRPRSRFEPDPDDDGSAWLLGVDDEVPSAVPDDVSPPVGPGRGDPDGSGPDRAPARPAAPPAVGVAAPAVAPHDAPPVRVETADAADRLPAPDPAPPGPDVDAVRPAFTPGPPSWAADPGADAVGPPSTEPSPTAVARPVPVLDVADPDDHHRPGEPGDDRRRRDPDLRDDDPSDEPSPRPRATARPAPAIVVDDPLVRPVETAEAATPPPVIIEIGRIEVRVAAGGPVVAAAPSRTALPTPGPSLADYLDGLAGTAGRRP